ncbi:MAG: four helix bundle protein [Thermoanaerobaculia bacterium]|nr:four helix bundle protein [Thermoanaerobaculia bacterium]
MSRIERFEQLIAWQKARLLTKHVYLRSLEDVFARDFALSGQIRRSAISIPSNIAEGFERGGRREFHQFLSIAKSSCAELRTQIYIALDIGYLNETVAKEMLTEAEEVGRIIGGLRRAVGRQTARRRRAPQSSVLSPQS